MKMQTSLGYLCCLLAFAGVGRAQVAAEVSLSQGTVTAGDTLTVSATVDKPFPCDAQMAIGFTSGDRGAGFEAVGTAHRGQTVFAAPVAIPRDLLGGTYESTAATLWPCPGYSKIKQLSLSKATVTVKAIPDSTEYPTQAGVALSLTQKQFLDTKISQLNNLNNHLTKILVNHADDGPQLRYALSGIIETATDALNETESQYRQLITKSGETTPAFFREFRVRYKALLVDLKAPVPGRAQATAPFGVSLQYVQLKQRTFNNHAGETLNLSGTYPPSAAAVREAILDNVAAYKYVKDTGRITFDLRFTSFPKGARIFYRKIIDRSYSEYSSPTDVQDATFELATWIFMFHKQGCRDDQIVQVDPYQDSHPDVSVEFNNCAKH